MGKHSFGATTPDASSLPDRPRFVEIPCGSLLSITNHTLRYCYISPSTGSLFLRLSTAKIHGIHTAMAHQNGVSSSSASPPPDCPASGSRSNGTNGTVKINGPVSKDVLRINPPVAKPTRKEVDATFAKFAQLINASNRPLPNRFGDGRDVSATEHEDMTGIRADIAALRRGGYIIESIQTLWMALRGKGAPADDKTMIVRSPCMCL